MSNTEAVTKRWNVHEPDISKMFFGFPYLRHYLIESAFNTALAHEYQENRWWAEDIFINEYLRGKKITSVLSLCCGFGVIERHFLPLLPDVRTCLGIDLAPQALEIARQRAVEEGLAIEYQCVDLNTYEWGENQYDLIIANGALHHLRELEHVFDGIHRSLKPDGILYANEHVGASYQDYPTRQLELINAAAYLVPPELRGRSPILADSLSRLLNRLRSLPDAKTRPDWSLPKRAAAAVVRTIFKPTSSFTFAPLHISQKPYLLKNDPSEGVRSAEIIPLMRRKFTDVEVHPYGGAILAYALDSAFYQRYDDANPAHHGLLEALIQIERHFYQTGELTPEYAVLIARP